MEDAELGFSLDLHVSCTYSSLSPPLLTLDSALLTLFQVNDAAGDPLTRWSALFSLICALMSLTYGCVYIVQFGTMRSMYKASRWAEVCV